VRRRSRHRARIESSPLIIIERVALRACRRVPDRRHAVKPALTRALRLRGIGGALPARPWRVMHARQGGGCSITPAPAAHLPTATIPMASRCRRRRRRPTSSMPACSTTPTAVSTSPSTAAMTRSPGGGCRAIRSGRGPIRRGIFMHMLEGIQLGLWTRLAYRISHRRRLRKFQVALGHLLALDRNLELGSGRSRRREGLDRCAGGFLRQERVDLLAPADTSRPK
jgi:hypothetical protein